MDSNIFTRSFDESLIRELPHLRIAPLREPVSSRNLRVPLTLEPNANRIRESGTIPKNGNPAGTLPPLNEPTGAANLIEGTTNPARLKNDFTPESLLEPPPRPILPAFVNLRALERFPYSSFDDDGHQSRKRRRIDLQPESFGEHVQLPMPHTQKEQRPPPFGPFAILNGLNEPPPNAALLPPIEAGSITQLLTKPSRDSIYVEPGLLTTSFTSDTTSGERREGRIADILDSPVTEKPSPCEAVSDNDKAAQSKHERDVTESTEAKPAEDTDAPLSPKTRGRSRKNIRRWTDDETIALLRGVISCGIGNWKEILAQQESNFNKRSASNLKDRFRVCCPSAYRTADPDEAIQHIRDALAKVLIRSKCDPSAKKALTHQVPTAEPAPGPSAGPPDLTHSGSSSSFSSCETHQDSPEPRCQSVPLSEKAQHLSNGPDSALGFLSITESYNPTKSRRRLRRPFTPAEDEALLKGYAIHGFQWTLIQQDKELDLGHRRATDLRDRFRTKFPHAYRDGGSVRGSAQQDGANRALKGELDPQDFKHASSDDRPGKPDGFNSSTTAVGEPILPSLVLPPTGRESSTGLPSLGFPFLDEGTINDDSVDLPPLIWDELS